MKFSVLFFIPVLIAGSSALANSATSDTGVAQFNHRQGVRAASSYGPPRGVQRRSRDTRRAVTKETKRQNTPTPSPDQIRAAILSLPAVKQLSAEIQQFLTTVPSEIWAALPKLSPDQFTIALEQLEKGQLPDFANAQKAVPPTTPSTQPQAPAA
ncbi:hypothetical protein TWF569_005659 [Orbilia oligospora]|uniref:Uncharacterized protein n=1 Tax=Orbilia oligospora TaxID=2813651 RepID=A0A7C8N6D1_ORBOL|nr:hypothetical protein TWF102_002881 [Orbilia oligospora]KAF3098412.1 hypothetical protein TWF706_006843 [Orbilia oligospora]KAF3118137.1 hypothetical protein TWF103_000166 [Orbilia oligospora]KAF3132666.1 hypothetical protein TWF594_009484 [Orbilia oligospora]KAF3134630.1 hypothetical protein TWF703_006287 [Orbilia oligospora]